MRSSSTAGCRCVRCPRKPGRTGARCRRRAGRSQLAAEHDREAGGAARRPARAIDAVEAGPKGRPARPRHGCRPVRGHGHRHRRGRALRSPTAPCTASGGQLLGGDRYTPRSLAPSRPACPDADARAGCRRRIPRRQGLNLARLDLALRRRRPRAGRSRRGAQPPPRRRGSPRRHPVDPARSPTSGPEGSWLRRGRHPLAARRQPPARRHHRRRRGNGKGRRRGTTARKGRRRGNGNRLVRFPRPCNSWMTCCRARLRSTPEDTRTWAATPSPSRMRPSRMCSVPM